MRASWSRVKAPRAADIHKDNRFPVVVERAETLDL